MGFSNDSNDSNDSNQGAIASFGSSGGFFADRVDLPFVTIEYQPGSPVAAERWFPGSFPARNWTPDWFSYLVLTQFVDTDWKDFDLLPAFAPDGDWTSAAAEAAIETELDDLVTAAQDERADALGEIIGQSNSFLSYFLDLLTATSGYPATVKVLTAANFVAGFTVIHYKGKYNRPRPTMLCPALMPPIPVPGHASFPSGHSTQAHLLALCMQDVLADAPAAQQTVLLNDLTALADRIARNREIGGFHYKSDTDAGIKLAGELHPLLSENHLPVVGGVQPPTWYQLALADAKKEWAP